MQLIRCHRELWVSITLIYLSSNLKAKSESLSIHGKTLSLKTFECISRSIGKLRGGAIYEEDISEVNFLTSEEIGMKCEKTAQNEFVVVELTPGGIATLCGLISVGDILIQIGQFPVNSMDTFDVVSLLSKPPSSMPVLSFCRCIQTSPLESKNSSQGHWCLYQVDFTNWDKGDKRYPQAFPQVAIGADDSVQLPLWTVSELEGGRRRPEVVGELMGLGFARHDVEAALRTAGGRAGLAASLLMDREEAREADEAEVAEAAAGRRGFLGRVQAWGRRMWQKVATKGSEC